MDAEYALNYHRFYSEHWWWRAREAIILDKLQELRPKGGFGPILDVGCGDGLLLAKLQSFGSAEGVEPNETMLTEAGRRRGHIHATAFDDHFEPGKRYGLILLLDVIEHLEDDVACLRRALKLLEPSGRVLITVPAFNWLWSGHDDINGHLRRYNRPMFREVARAADFRIDQMIYCFHWMVAAKLLVHWKERWMPSEPALPSIPPPWISSILALVCRAEQRLLTPLHLPLGGSLLIVGGRQDQT